jgi:sugar lactone lactonase YvrE
VDAQGNLYIADTGNHRVRRVDQMTGIITTVAGSGTAGYSGDNGAAANAQLNNPAGLVFDASGSLYISDTGNDVIREVTFAPCN